MDRLKAKCELYPTLIKLGIAEYNHSYAALRIGLMFRSYNSSPSTLMIDPRTFNSLKGMLNSKT